MKTCTKCNVSKSPTCFYRSSVSKDGRARKCRDCTLEEVREYRKTPAGLASSRGTVRRYHSSEKGKAAKRKYEETPKGRRKRREHAASHAARHPDKIAARALVTKALYHGVLVRLPCTKCGDPDTHGHHEDYGKPLEVVWLCRVHHAERHRQIEANHA